MIFASVNAFNNAPGKDVSASSFRTLVCMMEKSLCACNTPPLPLADRHNQPALG